MKSKINVISFATEKYIKSQKLLEEKSYIFGADRVVSYSVKDIDKSFIKKNKKAFSSPRGAGYWIWKPYVIHKTLSELPENEILMYIDSGAYPICDLNNLPTQQDITSFEMYDQMHKKWTKYDCFHVMNCLDEKYFVQKQRLGGFQIYRNNNTSRQFVEEYLYYCEVQENICITDEKSKYGNEFQEFTENRHDQSVFTNLCIKYNIFGHRDPSQWGNAHLSFYKDQYPQVFNLHRGNI